MAAVAILKTTKIEISQQRIDRSSRNLARLCKLARSGERLLKFRNFKKPRWRNESSNLQTKVKRKYWEVLMYKMKCTSRSQIQTQENKKANINVKNLTILKHVCIMSLSLCLYVCLSVIIKTRSSDFPELLMMLLVARSTASQVGQ